ncbi:peptidylprolyl isomerase [Celeribacter sp.]|uniref:peptidylprolyl isomerase n=1 Tax=Celeribacter sp. TaxID=1890673 RepID=UPI003A915958
MKAVADASSRAATRTQRTIASARAAFGAVAGLTALTLALGLTPPPAHAQGNLFAPVVLVNDQVITRYEVNQRIAMMSALGGSATEEVAIDALINERLQREAASRLGIQATQAGIDAGIAEFAERGGLEPEAFLKFLESRGVAIESFRDFVVAGVVWREFARNRFAPRVSISEAEIDRALQTQGPTGGLRLLLSEIFLPARTPEERAESERLASRIASGATLGSFAAAARQYSVAPSRERSGRLDWTPVGNLPAPLRAAVLALKPGEVTAPLSTGNAIGFFQLRAIEETEVPTPEPVSIEYAAYYIDGGRTEAGLARAAKVAANVDTCNDLYGIAKGQPAEVLQIDTLPTASIPQDVALELAKLDAGEVSTALTRANGQTLVFLMLCQRNYSEVTVEASAPAPRADDEDEAQDEAMTEEEAAAAARAEQRETIRNRLQGQRLNAMAANYLAELKADAVIERP